MTMIIMMVMIIVIKVEMMKEIPAKAKFGRTVNLYTLVSGFHEHQMPLVPRTYF